MVASEGRNAVLIPAILQGMNMRNFIKTKCECVVIFIFVFIHLCDGCENITLKHQTSFVDAVLCCLFSVQLYTECVSHVSSLELNGL